jgi:hypothetical protein
MDRQHCAEAIGIYKKFIARMDKVREFLRVAEVLLNLVSVAVGKCFASRLDLVVITIFIIKLLVQ